MSQANTSTIAFMVGAGVGMTVSAAAYVAWTRYQKSSELLGTRCTTQSNGPLDISDHVVKEHLSRNIQFFGEHGAQALASSRVVVVGLGGVGSHAAHMLLRAGVGHLKLVDFDQVWSVYRLCIAFGSVNCLRGVEENGLLVVRRLMCR